MGGIVSILFLAGCPSGMGWVPVDTDDGDASPDTNGAECLDADFDGYGEGDACQGPDCDDADWGISSPEDCIARCALFDDLAPGCACDTMDTRTCYLGPRGTRDVGQCRAGLMTCDGGRWGRCDGQIQPSSEGCDYADNDCDGTVDEDVRNECDACGDCHCVGDMSTAACDPWDAESEGVDVAPCESGACITLAGAKRGTYRHVFEGCGAVTEWLDISTDVELPEGSSIEWRVRSAQMLESLPAEELVLVGVLPLDSSPIPVHALDGVDDRAYLEVEATLVAGANGPPVLRNIRVAYECGFIGL